MRNRTDQSDKQDLSYLSVDIVNYIVTVFKTKLIRETLIKVGKDVVSRVYPYLISNTNPNCNITPSTRLTRGSTF